MNKNVLKIAFLLTLSFYSCDKAELTQNETTQANKFESQETMRQSSMFDYIESINVNNGLNTECENNILIFPSWEKYHQTIDKLDELTENYCDTFDANIPANISDDEYDALCESTGFDEDNILRQFEEDLGFCSLRQKIITAEDAWLDNQSETGPFIGNDPDDDFIDDESERALLNEGHEVIIGDRIKGYIIYKFIDDLGNFYQINNMDLDVLQALNHGEIPEGNPNLIINNSQNPTYDECKKEVKEINMEYGTTNRFKRISKIRKGVHSPFGPSKIKATTKGYKLKRRKWKRRRTNITASINGIDLSISGIIYVNCSKEQELLVTKSRKRRRVSVSRDCPELNTPIRGDKRDSWNVIDDKIYSYHQQGSLIVNKDYYDMPNN